MKSSSEVFDIRPGMKFLTEDNILMIKKNSIHPAHIGFTLLDEKSKFHEWDQMNLNPHEVGWNTFFLDEGYNV